MENLPQPLLEAVKELEGHFTVKTDRLKAVSEHFKSELEKGVFRKGHESLVHELTSWIGLSVEGGNIVRNAPDPAVAS